MSSSLIIFTVGIWNHGLYYMHYMSLFKNVYKIEIKLFSGKSSKFLKNTNLLINATNTVNLHLELWNCKNLSHLCSLPIILYLFSTFLCCYFPSFLSQVISFILFILAFIQSAVQLMPLIHPFTLTHQQRLAAMQGTKQLVRRNWGLGVLLRDTFDMPRVGSNRQPSDCQTTARNLLSHSE